jgi:molybdate transport system substrate-binding protein
MFQSRNPLSWRQSLLVVCLLSATTVSILAETATVQVAAAADLVYCLDELAATFHRQQPTIELKLTSGSSGNFFTQIEQGAPFDVFLSADIGYPKRLVAEGLASADSLFVYAHGKIVLWTTKPDAVPVVQGLNILADPQRVVTIAIANPDYAPYGRAAKAALEKAGLWTAVQSRLVLGENIAQTAQFVQAGNVDCGIVALSLLLGPKLKGVGTYQVIDPNLYPPLEQAVVLTRSGETNAAARTYLDFLRSQTARQIFDRYGFTIPASGS